MLVNYNLDIIRGSSFSAELSAKNADGTAINLLGFNVRGVIKYNYSDSTYLASLSPTILDSANGKIKVDITAAVTATMPVTQAVYDIEMYNLTTGFVAKLMDGRVNIHPEVTDIAENPA